MSDFSKTKPCYCLAFRIESLGLSPEGYPSATNEENPERLEFIQIQIFKILRKLSDEVDEIHKHAIFSSPDQALSAAIGIQAELEEINSGSQFPILYFACIGVDRFARLDGIAAVPSNYFDVAYLLSQSASPGEIYLSEYAFEGLSSKNHQCRFSKQLRLHEGESIVNVFEVVWNATEVEINQKRLNTQQNSEEIVRAFGLRFFATLFILFGAVYFLCLGVDGVRELFFTTFGEYFANQL